MAKTNVSASKLAAIKAKKNEVFKLRTSIQLAQSELADVTLKAKLEAEFDDLNSSISETGEEIKRPQRLQRPEIVERIEALKVKKNKGV